MLSNVCFENQQLSAILVWKKQPPSVAIWFLNELTMLLPIPEMLLENVSVPHNRFPALSRSGALLMSISCFGKAPETSNYY